MTSAQELKAELKRIQVLLNQEGLFSLSNEEKKRLLDDSLKLVQKLDRVAESSLLVGLLGGTGVGKSTLMNALACSPIASTSHRRPHTDQVLVYHHSAMPLPDAFAPPFPWQEISHDADAMSHLILCDLPDFDSLLTWHREHTRQFLEYLDILVWVVSPEKYADEGFYAFLRQAPKAMQNFYFVLNKVDLLFGHEEPGKGYSGLASLTARFTEHLEKNGIVEPIIYPVSARVGCHSIATAGWNHFSNFRNQLFRLRGSKELEGIKSANLDVEVKHVARVLEKEVCSLNILRRVLQGFAQELEARRSEWLRTGRESFARIIQGDVEEEYMAYTEASNALLGIGHAIAVLARDWTRLTKGSQQTSCTMDRVDKTGAFEPLRHELERLENQITYRLLRDGFSSETEEYGRRFLDAHAEWRELSARLWMAADLCLANHRGFPVGGFRAFQYASYLCLSSFFLLAVIGEAGLRDLIEYPNWYNTVGLIWASIEGLFSAKGFAALGTYVLLQIFLGLRFYRRYKKLLQRHAQKFIESLKLELGQIWEEELDILIRHLMEKAKEAESRMAAFSTLCRSDTRG